MPMPKRALTSRVISMRFNELGAYVVWRDALDRRPDLRGGEPAAPIEQHVMTHEITEIFHRDFAVALGGRDSEIDGLSLIYDRAVEHGVVEKLLCNGVLL